MLDFRARRFLARVALVPPLWRRMDPKVAAHDGGNLSLANRRR